MFLKRVAGCIVNGNVVEENDHYSEAGSHDIVDNDLKMWDASMANKRNQVKRVKGNSYSNTSDIAVFRQGGGGSWAVEIAGHNEGVWSLSRIYISVSLYCRPFGCEVEDVKVNMGGST